LRVRCPAPHIGARASVSPVWDLAVAACGERLPSLFGAFFPAWLLCATIGALGSIGLRSFVIAMGLEDAMPFKLLVYVAFAVGLALWLWLSLFGDR
jgi:hypothetical protein